MREFITVGPEHIGKFSIKAFDRTWMVADHFGTLRDYDLGKRIYLCSNDAEDYQYLQIESNEQRDARLHKDHPIRRYYVEYESRANGAIGKFVLMSDYVDATGSTDALDKFRAKYQDRFEFRFPSRCYVVD